MPRYVLELDLRARDQSEGSGVDPINLGADRRIKRVWYMLQDCSNRSPLNVETAHRLRYQMLNVAMRQYGRRTQASFKLGRSGRKALSTANSPARKDRRLCFS